MPAPAPPPQPQPPQPDSIILDKFSGLKNTVDAERLGPDELEYAVNIDLDDVGQVHRRRGKTKVASGSFGSLFTTADGTSFGIKNGSIGIIRPDYSFVTLDTGYPSDPLAYVQVGPTLYFSSRTKAGKIDLDTMALGPWGSSPDYWLSPVVNPTVTLPAIRGRLLGPPPLATCLCYFNGRIYLGNGRQVWSTELYLYDYVDKTKNFWTFEADITMLGAVSDGIYVGTKEGVWFVNKEFRMETQNMAAKRVRVLDSPCIPGSLCYVPQELANPPQVPLNQDSPVKMAILFLTSEGYCGGEDSGVCFNYSENKFVFPDAQTAVGFFRRQQGINQYIAVTNSGGTPSANARVGDYVDAELVRGGAWNTIRDCVKFGDILEAYVDASEDNLITEDGVPLITESGDDITWD